MKGKYKKIYLVAFLLFIVINIAAVFFVFKKYRKDSNNSAMLSSAKFELSKLKEKIGELEANVPIEDSLLLKEVESIKLSQVMVDSLLKFNTLNNQSLSEIADKIAQLTSESGKVEKSIDALATTNSQAQKP
jgi:DNA-directed RNA polymerase alpha subunit